jgi:hypothetical protein
LFRQATQESAEQEVLRIHERDQKPTPSDSPPPISTQLDRCRR